MMNNIKLIHSDFVKCSFKQVNISNTFMNHVMIKKGIIANTNMKHFKCEDLNVRHIIFRDTDFDNAYFYDVWWYKCDFVGQTMKNFSIEDAGFGECKMMKMRFNSNVDFYKTHYVDTDMRNTDFGGASADWWQFEKCNLDNCIMTNMDIGTYANSSLFEDTSLRNVDFSGSRLCELVFHRSDLSGAKFINVDMTNSTIVDKEKTKLLGTKFKNIYVSDRPMYKKCYFEKYVKPENRYPGEYLTKPWKDVKHLIIKK
jgi:uncharacterized protein YjbI with pentapeptide repeats